MMRAASDVEPVSRILYGVAAADGHSSRPVITDRLKRPTRKFGVSSRDALNIGLAPVLNSFPIWSCSVWGLPCLAHYCASGALLPHLFTLTATSNISGSAGLRLLCLLSRPAQKRIRLSPFYLPRYAAVYFLWHFPSSGFSAAPKRATASTLPDVIRHTALRSSDFPLSGSRSPGNPASTSQTATIRFDISYPYYKMNLGSKGFRSPTGSALIEEKDTS